MATVLAEPTIRVDSTGVMRVGNTRVTLDTLVAAYHEGASAEEIALRYESLSLADVYEAISYYLRHRTEVDAYLVGRKATAQTVRREVDSRQGFKQIREMLSTRRV